MNKEAQDADDGITHVIDEEHVHHHCFVASGERPLVPHKTHEEDQLVEELKRKKTRVQRKFRWEASSKSLCTYIDCAQQQQRGAQAQGVNGAQDEGNQEEEDALWLGQDWE